MTFGKHTHGNPIIHWGSNESKLIIGNYCSIGENVNIYLGGTEKLIDWKNINGDVIIGNDIWIGANALILPNVRRIGDGAVIAAGAVVNKDVPPYAIVVGNPARIVRFRFPPDVIEELLSERWWEKPIEELKPAEFCQPYHLGVPECDGSSQSRNIHNQPDVLSA